MNLKGLTWHDTSFIDIIGQVHQIIGGSYGNFRGFIELDRENVKRYLIFRKSKILAVLRETD